MENTARIEIADEIVRLLHEHNGKNCIAIDVSVQSSWTDLFVIATVDSHAHLRGLTRHLKNYFARRGLTLHHSHKKITEEGWQLLDCGDVVVHLMDREARGFYELEKLWFEGTVLQEIE